MNKKIRDGKIMTQSRKGRLGRRERRGEGKKG
jgi:hypothetical protein